MSDSPSRISCFTFGLRERHTLIPFPGIVLSDFLVLMALFDPRVLSPKTTVFAFPPRGLMSFVFRGSDGIERIASRLLNVDVRFECFASEVKEDNFK